MSTVDTWPRERREDIAVVVSELVTNSVRHSRSGLPGGSVVVTTEQGPGLLTVRVVDQGPRHTSPSVPAMREPDFMEDTGRGLPLVAEFSDEWGTVQHPDGTCEVWARFGR